MTVGRAVVLAVAMAAWTSGSAADAAPTVSLVEARVSHVEDITGQPGAPALCFKAGNEPFCIDGSWRVTFTIDRTLAGEEVDGDLFQEQGSAQPRLGLSYLLVIGYSEGKPSIEWAGLSRFGLCLEQPDMVRFGLSEVATRYPCKQ